MNTEVSARSTWHNLHSSDSPKSDVLASWSGEPHESASRHRRAPHKRHLHHHRTFPRRTRLVAPHTRTTASRDTRKRAMRSNTHHSSSLTSPLTCRTLKVTELAGRSPNRQKLVPYNAISTTITFVLVGGGADPWQRRPEGRRKAICCWLRLLHASKTSTSLAVTADIETERKCHL